MGRVIVGSPGTVDEVVGLRKVVGHSHRCNAAVLDDDRHRQEHVRILPSL
jgi:hypothetical protein